MLAPTAPDRTSETFEETPNSKSEEGVLVLDALAASINAMWVSVVNTVKNSNGQFEQRIVKNKELRMTPEEFDWHVRSLMEAQGNRCALSGIDFQPHGLETDPNLLPSLDRIDSDGHYEAGNVQVVCRFINFWKSDTDNKEFKRLLTYVMGPEARE